MTRKYFSALFIFSRHFALRDEIFVFSSLSYQGLPSVSARRIYSLTVILFRKVNPPWEFFIIFIFCEDWIRESGWVSVVGCGGWGCWCDINYLRIVLQLTAISGICWEGYFLQMYITQHAGGGTLDVLAPTPLGQEEEEIQI